MNDREHLHRATVRAEAPIVEVLRTLQTKWESDVRVRLIRSQSLGQRPLPLIRRRGGAPTCVTGVEIRLVNCCLDEADLRQLEAELQQARQAVLAQLEALQQTYLCEVELVLYDTHEIGLRYSPVGDARLTLTPWQEDEPTD